MVARLNIAAGDRLYIRADRIQQRKANGLWVPIMRHLAFRGRSDAMVQLAHWYSEAGGGTDIGRANESGTAANLYYRAWRSGSATAAQSMAMVSFNSHNLAGYRQWLHRAARAGDDEAVAELRRFETRLPHGYARVIGRQRPERRGKLGG